jgi:hypothetical protein
MKALARSTAGHENYEKYHGGRYRSGVGQRLLQFFESSLVRPIVAKPFLASSDKRLAFGYPSIINALLPPQGYRLRADRRQ